MRRRSTARALRVELREDLALDDHVAGRRGVEPAGEGEQRRLAGARRAHDGDELALARRSSVTPRRAWTAASPCPWTRVTSIEVQDRAHRDTPVDLSDVACVRGAPKRLTAWRRSAYEPCLAVVEPADLGLGLEDQGVGDEGPREVGVVGAGLDAG